MALALVAALFAVTFTSTTGASETRSFVVNQRRAHIYAERNTSSRIIGELELGMSVTPRECGARCEGWGGYLAIEPRGFVRLSSLRIVEGEIEARPRTITRVVRPTISRAAANGSGTRGRIPEGYSIAVYSDSLGATYAERPNGTYVASADLARHRPSSLVGASSPTGTLAFFLRDATLPNGEVLRRYDRRLVSTFDESFVHFEGGKLERSAVRIAKRRARPAGIPANAAWIHVDIGEQILGAYLGDEWKFATLVSTGDLENPTPLGLFRLHQKTQAMTMYGDQPQNYRVEGVDHVQFFVGGYALHSAYWHDRFGERGSHGCVNLSPSDARTLFEWAPPSMPIGAEN